MRKFAEKMSGYFKLAIEKYLSSIESKLGLKREGRDPWVVFVVEDAERNVID
jgi:hypothetical protein